MRRILVMLGIGKHSETLSIPETMVDEELTRLTKHIPQTTAEKKALGACTKMYTEGTYSELQVTSKNFPIKLSIPRDLVCKKEVKYICEPLFSTEEVESL